MKKKFTFLFVLIAVVYSGCSPDAVTIQVIRNPSIKFSLNGANWKSDRYSVSDPSMVVVYPTDTTQPGKLYNRFVLQATGKDDQNKKSATDYFLRTLQTLCN